MPGRDFQYALYFCYACILSYPRRFSFLPLYTKSFNVHFEVKEKCTFITSATFDYLLKVSVYMEKPEEIETNRHLYILAIHVENICIHPCNVKTISNFAVTSGPVAGAAR